MLMKRQAHQMLALTVDEGLLSTPALLTARTWKYQVPELRLSITYDSKPTVVMLIFCVSALALVP
jgi:hypothetical protein